MRIVVVFPAPLGPRKPVTVPGSQRKVTSSTTALPPNRLVNFSASIMPSGFPFHAARKSVASRLFAPP
jgi:hypothetical protein